ncbi:MAG: hypothetical protein ACLU8S_03175 [Coprococcus phoceensis]
MLRILRSLSTQIAQVINQVQSMAAASERVFEFLGGRRGRPVCR